MLNVLFKKKGKTIIITLALFLVSIFLVHYVEAAQDQFSAFSGSAHFNTTTSIGAIVAGIIKVFLSLLSIIFIVLILYAGFNWMTASGDEKKVEDAKTTIQRATIGLVIIIAAFSITYFVFSVLPYSSGGTTEGAALGPADDSSSDFSAWDYISGTAGALWDWATE